MVVTGSGGAGEREARTIALNRFMDALNAKRPGSILRLGDRPVQAWPALGTGALTVDLATGIGGVPKGRITEVFGAESGGKTTLTLSLIARVQAEGGVALMVDAEHTLDPEWATRLGVDTDALLLSQPDTGEEALEICEEAVRSGGVDLIVVDSVAALVPKAELDGELGDNQVALHARLMSTAMKRLTMAMSPGRTTVVFTNQLRSLINRGGMGPQTTTTGGRALKFYASMRIEVTRIGWVQASGSTSPIGSQVRVKVVKSKVAAPFRSGMMEILFDRGICWAGSVLDAGLAQDVVTQTGSHYHYRGERLGQGREAVRALLTARPDLCAAIATECRAKVLATRLAVVAPELAPVVPAVVAPTEGEAAVAGQGEIDVEPVLDYEAVG
jgi:recombination protein RecA